MIRKMERQARRKKITSRETDRMALITGRIQNIDPNLAKSSSFSDPRGDHLPAQHVRSCSEPVPPEKDNALFEDHPQGGGDARDALIRHDNNEEFSKGNASGSIDEKSALVTTRGPTASHYANSPEKPLEYHFSIISPREIHFSIISSENTRVICSFVIAVLVLLSHINLPHKLIKSKSLIAYRPLYAVLLTDLLIVAARLALYSQGKEDEKEVKLEADDQNWDGAVKLLEWGLMLHQTLRAIFIDCSLYLAVVICGLSLF